MSALGFVSADQSVKAELAHIDFTFSCGQSGCFALATAQRLNLPLAIFVDTEGDPVAAVCKVAEGLFFDATGPTTANHLWQKTRMPMRELPATEQIVRSAFDVTDDDVESAKPYLDRLLDLLAKTSYH